MSTIQTVLFSALVFSKGVQSKPAQNSISGQHSSLSKSFESMALSVLGGPRSQEQSVTWDSVDQGPHLTQHTVNLPMRILSLPPQHSQRLPTSQQARHQVQVEQDLVDINESTEDMVAEFRRKFSLDQPKAEQIVKYLHNKYKCEGKQKYEAQTQAEANFTWLGVHPIGSQIASNLANFGHPFGGPNVQNRAGANDNDKQKLNVREKTSPWFENK